MSNQLSTTDQADFKRLKIAAIAALELSADSWRTFLVHMREIQKRELWRIETKTWHEFLDAVCAEVGKTRRHFYKLLQGEEIRFQLKEKASVGSDTQNAKSLAKTVDSMSTEALLATRKASPEERLKVVEVAAKQFKGSPPTALAVTAAVKGQQQKPAAGEKPDVPLDKEGTKITNKALLAMWERRDEVQPHLTQLSNLKSTIKKSLETGDALYAFIGNAVIADISSLYSTLSNLKLHAVCTDCQGWTETKGKAGCGTCHGIGFISKTHFDQESRPEIKEIRKRAAAMEGRV